MSEQVMVTNGGDELIRLVVSTFLESNASMVILDPGYTVYAVVAAMNASQVVHYPLDESWQVDAAKMIGLLNASNAGVLCISNPHAPSGILYPLSFFDEVAASFNGIILLDEAYIDFIDPSLNYDSLSLLKKHDNIIVLRTLSKGYSLAGLRLGYALANEQIITPMLSKTRDTYNIGYLPQKLAEAALQDQNYMRQCANEIRMQRQLLEQRLHDMGFNCTKSEANFILCTLPSQLAMSAESLYKRLKDKKLFVRYFDHPMLQDKLRITVGLPEENAALLQQLERML